MFRLLIFKIFWRTISQGYKTPGEYNFVMNIWKFWIFFPLNKARELDKNSFLYCEYRSKHNTTRMVHKQLRKTADVHLLKHNLE